MKWHQSDMGISLCYLEIDERASGDPAPRFIEVQKQEQRIPALPMIQWPDEPIHYHQSNAEKEL